MNATKIGKKRNQHSNDNKKAALICKHIIKAEAIKTMYMKLRQYMNPQGRSSLNHGMVPANNLWPKLAQLWRKQGYLRHQQNTSHIWNAR
jgi:hypothetical protein